MTSNSGSAISGDAYIDDGGIVLKSTDGDKKWTWQDNAYWDEWGSSEHIAIAADKALRVGPTCAESPGRLITLNWNNRGNIVLGNPGALTVPGNASGWLIMNHGSNHNGGVISGVANIDAYSGTFANLSVSGTAMTMSNVSGSAAIGGVGSIAVLPSGASAPLEIKGASDPAIWFPDGTTQYTSPTGCCSGNATDITTIETALDGITGCGLSCSGVTGQFIFDSHVLINSTAQIVGDTTFNSDVQINETLYFYCGGGHFASIECTGNGNLNIPSGNV